MEPIDSKFTDCVLQFSSSSEDDENNFDSGNNYPNLNFHHHFIDNHSNLTFQNSNLLNSSQKPFKPCPAPIPAPRKKHLNNQKSTNTNNKPLINQRNLIKNLNQQQVADSTFTPQLLHKQLFLEKPNFVRTGSLDRKLAEVKKLNFSEWRLRLKQQQQEIEQNLLKKNLIQVDKTDTTKNSNLNDKIELTSVLNDCKNLQNLDNTIGKLSFSSKPPTPPQHKIPSWETKFYKLALSSINQITSECTTNRYTNDDHWYLSNSQNNDPINVENEFLKINQLPFYKNLNQTVVRIDNLIENDENKTAEAFIDDLQDKEQLIDQENEFNDYDLPPDAFKKASLKASLKSTDFFDKNNQLRQSKFIERQVEPLEKSGYLLCNKNKNWKQRYFILKNNIIFYYKTQTDVKKKKLKGTIKLTKDVSVIKKENSSSFQIMDNKSKSVYTLTADSLLTMEDWVRVIRNSLKTNEEKRNQQANKDIDLDGWIIRRKNGYSKKFWLVLRGKKLYFYKNSNNENLVSSLDLNEFKVLESLLENSLISNDLLNENKKEYVISLESNNKDPNTVPIYLVLNDKRSFNNWLYHLTISTIENSSNLTDFEKIIYKLISVPVLNDDFTDLDSNQLWNEQLMIHSKDENLNQPLTSLETINLKNEALKLFKSIQLFSQVKININSGIEYHVALAQSAFEICFEYPQLQSELFCQLIKQSSSPNRTDSFNFIQSFQLISLAVSIFTPKSKVLWLLKNFLRRNSNDETECGKYAIYCQRTLERCLTNGCREVKPSRLEILAILLRNPYQHSLPFSLPVYFTNDNYFVVSFDGLTTIEEFAKRTCEQSEIRPLSQSGYALYSDDPVNASKTHFLPWKCKLGDVISRWETSLKNNNLGKFESKRVIKLIIKKRLFFKSTSKTESDKEKMLLAYQINQELMNDRIPIIDNNLSLHLAALLILFENSRNLDDESLKNGIDKFYPKKDLQNIDSIQSSMRAVIEKMGNLTKKDCIRIYLNCIKKWPICNANLFEALTLENKRPVYLTVDEIYFFILDKDLKLISNHFLNKFLKFGHKEDRLIIYLFNRLDCDSSSSVTRSSFRNDSSNSFHMNNNEKLEFHMDKDKINELILLIADYLNVENSIKFEKLTSGSNSLTTTGTINSHGFEFSPTNELPNTSLYDIKQYGTKLNRNDSFNRSTNSFGNNNFTVKEDQEYSEIYSPSYENQDFSLISNQHLNSNMPPTLPLHRCATWEKNLYELCSKNFDHFIEHSHHDLNSILVKDDQLSQTDFYKKHTSISSMISGEYYTNQFSNRNLANDLSNGFASISQYSISKNSLSKRSSISRCNSDNSSSLNDDNFTLKDHLLILSKKMKWKKRIVLIKNSSIYYFKNENDLNKNKPKGKFKIDAKTVLEEEDKCFKLIDNQTKKSISISSENPIKLKQLITVILTLLEKLSFKNLDNQESINEGWLTMIKNGICARKWSKLKNHVLFFYQESTDDEPNLVLNLMEYTVEEAESNDYEYADWSFNFNMERKKEYCIAIESDDKSNSVFLVFNEKKDFDIWFYYLSIASNKVVADKDKSDRSLDKVDSAVERSATVFEQIISKLMKIEYDEGLIALESSYLWNEPVLCSINETITQPLTTLKSTTLNDQALKLYKSVQLFSQVKINMTSGIEYHVALAQGSIELCLDYTELQNEFYCQLIKLSNSSNQNANKLMRPDSFNRTRHEDNHTALQALQLFAISISIFIPKGKLLWFVKHFLRRQSDEQSNLGRYAIYCTKALDRAMQTGNRDFKPSRMEILGILLRNPNQHSSPHSIPVHFLNGEYLVVGFDGSTTIEEFSNQIRKEAGLNCYKRTEFALYCDNPIQENYDHYLQANLKLADIISQWESALRKKLGRFENNKVVKLTFKNRQYFKKKSENDKDRQFLAYKICDDIKQSKFPVNHDLAIQFAALLAQCELGNLDNYLYNNQLDKEISKFYPQHLKSKVHSVFLVHDLKSKWAELQNTSAHDCIKVYLNCAKKWSLFGSSLFKALSVSSIKVEQTLSKYVLPSNTT